MSPTIDAPIRVLFATDLHARSRALLAAAGDLARALEARITLVHAVEPRATRGLARAARETLRLGARTEAEAALARQAEALRESGLEVDEPILTVDDPAHRAILAAVESTGADLVVAGSTARGGRGHRIGSTADRLLRASSVPVLVLRGEPSVPFGAVAFLTDFSPRSRRAHRSGARLLPTAPGARLDLLHVGDETLRVLDKTYEERTHAETFDEARDLNDALGLTEGRMRPRIEWGRDPVDVLLSRLSPAGYDVVVLGTHGHGPVRRALIGSVAMGLAQSAPCSVMVVPGR